MPLIGGYHPYGLASMLTGLESNRACRFVEWAQNEIAVVPDFHKRILLSDEAHFWLNGYVNKQNCRIWSEANPQVYIKTPLHPEKLTVWRALWAGGIIDPYYFKNDEGHNVTVNGDRYRAMITNFFTPDLNNHDVQELWFQQDGATCLTARTTIDLLKDRQLRRNSTRRKIGALKSTCYTCHGFYPGYSRIKSLTCIAIFDVLMTFPGRVTADMKTTKAVRKYVGTKEYKFGLKSSKDDPSTCWLRYDCKKAQENYIEVFRSELIAIRRGLQCAAQLEDRFQEIWILTDSRASIQHLANWGDIGDQTSLDILSLLDDLSSGHSIHFQWIPSHVGIEGNERADFLARTAAVEGVSPRGNLTFSEISTISKLELNRQIKTPPSHASYFAKCPGESFRLSSRPLPTTYSRFLSGHTRALRFSNGQNTFPECHWCSSGEASPNHILLCLGFKKDEVLCYALLFLDVLQVFGFMGIV
ncbi:RNase H domain-containing protein [Trichonephila clavipes]|nr:RNase H domain-containing protein [Trichonephila clavipes]